MANFTFRSIVASAMAAFALAASAYTFSPAPGVVQMDAFPGGVNSIEIDGMNTINRTSGAVASFYRNGELIRQIPSSNQESVYCFEGFDKVEKGGVHITFYLPSGPGAEGGEYKIIIGANFFTDASGNVNDEITLNYTVPYSLKKLVTYSPTPNVRIEEIAEVTLTFPEGTTFVLDNTPESGTDGDGNAITVPAFGLENASTGVTYALEAKAEGNVVKLAFENESVSPLTETGNWNFSICAGKLTATIPEVGTLKNSDTNSLDVVFQIMPATAVPNRVVPAEGTYNSVETEWLPVQLNSDNSMTYANVLFTLYMPAPMQYVLMSRPYWIKLDENGKEMADTKVLLAIKKCFEYSDLEEKWVFNNTTLYVATESAEQQSLNPAPGNYKLVIPKGCYYLTGLGQNPVSEYYYTISDGSDFKYTISPLSGSTLDKLEYVQLTFDEGYEISIKPNAYANFSNGIMQYALQGTLTPGLTNEVVFRLPEPLTTAGEWKFQTPTSGFSVQGKVPVVEAYYTIDPASAVEKPAPTLTPAEGTVSQIYEFGVSYEGYNDIGKEGIAVGNAGVLVGESLIEFDEEYMDYSTGQFILRLKNEITAEGTYVLTIPEKYFYVCDENAPAEGFFSDAIEATYEVGTGSFVQNLFAEDANVTVYTAAGVCLYKDADRAVISELEPGFYIINSKKVILTK